jgi:DNA-binding transcriptional ArsR family regulator
MAQKKSNNSKSVRVPVTYMAVPRPWLIALAAVLIVPWLTVAAIWLKPMSRAGVSIHDAGDATPVTRARAGKWGELTLVPIVISPPMELVFTDWGFMPRPIWFFPGSNADTVTQMLQSAGVPAADAAQLRAETRSEPQIPGAVLAPDPAWVRALAPETRARIYRVLAKSELNVNQTQAFRYPGASPEEWLDPSLISPHTRQLVEPLIYRDGSYMLFSDIELVRAEISSDYELRRLGKTLLRQPTVIAHLSVNRAADLDALVEYWGRGGRRTEIRPLLESVSGGGTDRFIDVIHLLPPFARNHLYCYPELSAADLDRPAVFNCLWTSLNFFLPNPDDRFLDAAVAIKTLKEDYFVVEADFELGDIVAFLDQEGDIFHAAVYIADDLLFSKNGISAMAPWTLISLDDIKGYYRWRSENPRLIVHRRKGF